MDQPMKILNLIAVLMFVAVTGCTSDSPDDPAAADPSPAPPDAQDFEYIGCTGKEMVPRYVTLQTVMVTWVEGVTPKMKYRLDISDAEGNLRKLWQADQPTVDSKDGTFQGTFAGRGEQVKIKYLLPRAAGDEDGHMEVVANGKAFTLSCSKNLGDQLKRQRVDRAEMAKNLVYRPWCTSFGKFNTKQLIFTADGRMYEKIYEGMTSEKIPFGLISTRTGTWIATGGNAMTTNLQGEITAYSDIFFDNRFKREESPASVSFYLDTSASGMGQIQYGYVGCDAGP